VGSDVLITGHALAPTITTTDGTVIPNSITGVTINGSAVGALDAAGNFFANVEISLGQNVFTFVATDQYGQTVNTSLTLIGEEEDDEIDEDDLVKAPAVKAEYGRTSFNERDEVLYSDLKIRNTGTATLSGPILVALRNISDASVTVKNFDGVLEDGTPYYDISNLVGDGRLVAGELSGMQEIAFHNPNRVQFNYQLEVWSKKNEAPTFSTVPVVDAAAGANYSYDAGAIDAENDALTYSLVTKPAGATINAQSGVVVFNAATVGIHEFVIKAEDGRGGEATQRFVLEVL
jgi:hypothetical protein